MLGLDASADCGINIQRFSSVPVRMSNYYCCCCQKPTAAVPKRNNMQRVERHLCPIKEEELWVSRWHLAALMLFPYLLVPTKLVYIISTVHGLVLVLWAKQFVMPMEGDGRRMATNEVRQFGNGGDTRPASRQKHLSFAHWHRRANLRRPKLTATTAAKLTRKQWKQAVRRSQCGAQPAGLAGPTSQSHK